jgi:hypothetical protein
MRTVRALYVIAAALCLSAASAPAVPLGTTITYQGRLTENGSPVNGIRDLYFDLFDAADNGQFIATTSAIDAVVTNGVFTVQLNFGANAFNGDERWMRITVEFTTLSPRQRITGAPHALIAVKPWTVNSANTNISYTAGNVGVGVANPTFPLVVQGAESNGLSTGSFVVANSGQFSVTTLVMDGNEIDSTTNGAASDLILQGTNAGDVILATGGGRVGVGTTSPGVKLDVVGSGGGTMFRVFNGANRIFSADSSGISLGPSESATLRLWVDTSNPSDHTGIVSLDGVTKLIVTPDYVSTSTKFGVNRSPATYALEVNGNASKDAAGDWVAHSDARIKKDVKTVEKALETLDKVRLVEFRYKDDYRRTRASLQERPYLNVIAQEFAEVFPDYVEATNEKLPDGDAILAVDTYPLTIYSAAAIQELHAKLKETQRENEELKRRLDRLEKLVEAKEKR